MSLMETGGFNGAVELSGSRQKGLESCAREGERPIYTITNYARRCHIVPFPLVLIELTHSTLIPPPLPPFSSSPPHITFEARQGYSDAGIHFKWHSSTTPAPPNATISKQRQGNEVTLGVILRTPLSRIWTCALDMAMHSFRKARLIAATGKMGSTRFSAGAKGRRSFLMKF